MRCRRILSGSVANALIVLALGVSPAIGATATYSGPGAITDVTAAGACSGSSGDIEQAVDPSGSYVYQEWEACSGRMGFARSTDGGSTYGPSMYLPASSGGWDATVAVSPKDGTVYAAFMVTHGSQSYPVVDISHDHGQSFSRSTALLPPQKHNWGDAPYIAVGPDGSVYITWDYGPSSSSVQVQCSSTGSCYMISGDLNEVIQSSTNGGVSFGAMSHISPGYPASGADWGPLVVEPSGQLDVLYQGYTVTNAQTYALGPGYSYYTYSTNRGQTWSTPVAVGISAGTMTLDEWWMDGAIAIDAGGTLYATWDTQSTNPATDIGWISYLSPGRTSWSQPVRVTDTANAPHIVEVAGGPPGIAYVGWLTNSDPRGYAQYLNTFSTSDNGSWLSAPRQISTQFGDPSVWPGDTFGISTVSTSSLNQVLLSWGSATPTTGGNAHVFAASPVSVTVSP